VNETADEDAGECDSTEETSFKEPSRDPLFHLYTGCPLVAYEQRGFI
jgi:hypothetical protein